MEFYFSGYPVVRRKYPEIIFADDAMAEEEGRNRIVFDGDSDGSESIWLIRLTGNFMTGMSFAIRDHNEIYKVLI